MEASEDFHDLFSGGATPAFDSSDPLDSVWAELDANDLPRRVTQEDRASVDPQALQQHTTEEEEETEGEEDDEEAGGHDGQPRLLMLHEWDSTTEPSLDTLRYTVEWKAVLNTKRIGMNTEENVFLTLGAFWDAALHGKIDEALSREFAPQDRPEPCKHASRNARMPAADHFRCAHAPEDSMIGAGASYGTCTTVDDISDIFVG